MISNKNNDPDDLEKIRAKLLAGGFATKKQTEDRKKEQAKLRAEKRAYERDAKKRPHFDSFMEEALWIIERRLAPKLVNAGYAVNRDLGLLRKLVFAKVETHAAQVERGERPRE